MKAWLIPFILICTGCISWQMAHLRGRRDCLVKAIGFQDAYNADSQFDANRWSRILGIFWDDERRLGHAVCVYRFGGKIIVQGAGEKAGGWTLTRDLSLISDPLALAKLYAPGTPIREAYFFEDL